MKFNIVSKLYKTSDIINGGEDIETAKKQSSKINLYSAINDIFPTYSFFGGKKKEVISRDFCTWNTYIRISCKKNADG